MVPQSSGRNLEIKILRLGRGTGKDGTPKLEEGKVLNMVIRRADVGRELKAVPGHAELIIAHLDLQDAKSVSTPGVDQPVASPEDIEDLRRITSTHI